MEDDGQEWGKCIHYNLGLMQQSLEFFEALVWVTIVVEVLLDILCYKYRYLAKYFIYIHYFQLVITRMLPNPQADLIESPIQMVFIFGTYNFGYYCD